MADDDNPVLTERRDGVLLITLNRPDARNAVNLPLAEGIAAALDELDADGDLTAGVLTGVGKGFCAGMDLRAFAGGERPWVGDRGFAGIVQRAARKPLIAAVEGFAVAGGLEVALACDLVVAAKGEERFASRDLRAIAGARFRRTLRQLQCVRRITEFRREVRALQQQADVRRHATESCRRRCGRSVVIACKLENDRPDQM